MPVVTLARATATAAGLDVTGDNLAGVDRATATATGFPVLVHGAPIAVPLVPDALRLEILTVSGVQLVNDLVVRRGLQFSVEHNGAGSISFETDLDAFPGGLDDPALDPSNLVRVHFGDLPGWPNGVAEGYIAAAVPDENEAGAWTVTVSCPGSWDVLELGVLWPPAGAVASTREFSYTAGEFGPAFVPTQWGTPVGKNVKKSFRWRNRWPRGWPESTSQWIWSSSPEKPSPVGTRYFIAWFTLATPKAVRFHVAGDSNLRMHLNGALLKVVRSGGWKRNTAFTRWLPAGTHTVAASVHNFEGGPSGFLCAVARLGTDGKREAWILRSSPSTFKIRSSLGTFAQVPLPPDGWYPADVLRQHVVEAAARGVDFHPQITLTYTSKADTTGSAWSAKGPVEYDIGTSGAQLGEMIRAGGVDVAMLPGLKLAAWKSRGFDLRSRVAITTPAKTGWGSRGWARVRTVGLTHHEAGWTETNGPAEVSAEFGRRELALSGGGLDNDSHATQFATAALTTAGAPEETLEATISTAQMIDSDNPAPVPFRDFNVADIILMRTAGGFTPVKVMSISGTETDTREVIFTIAGYPV